MNEQRIETLRDQTLGMIDIAINLLQQLIAKPRILSKRKSDTHQSLDRTTAPEYLKMLTGEINKLNNLEMVLAVVGTMKAGKSTTINAIVGTEVLPNRNRPMTALPTLIRHTPRQVAPVLKFENDQPIHRLMGELRKALKKKDNAEMVCEISRDSDMMKIIMLIKDGEKFQTFYKGAKAISQFLQGLNDLVRLSQKMGIEFPFSEYDEIHELPVIEVKFAHLRGASQSKGRLTLLDTPGPNESCQPRMRTMMRQHLRRASAVLAILDYTQLKSEADAEVRKELSEIASMTEGRLFTLVNKFDQKDRHGDTPEEIKKFVSTNLLAGLAIQSENIFPVSSKWAYLSHRARHELHVNKKLPDASKQAWVADFFEAALGRSWESKIGDIAEVKAGADALWEESHFDAPLENIVRTAHARAAMFLAASTADKLIEVADAMQDLLSTRNSVLCKKVEVIQPQIKALRNNISLLAMNKKLALTLARKSLQYLQDKYPDKLLWAHGVNPNTFRNLKVKQFLYSYCWVIYSKGAKPSDIKVKLPELQQAFKDFEPNALSRMRSITPVLNVMNSRNKAECFLAGAKEIYSEGFASFKRRLRNDGVHVLESLPGIGAISKSLLAENIGIAEIPDADLWLKRAANLCETASETVLTSFLAEQLCIAPHLIELALCQYGADDQFERFVLSETFTHIEKI